VQLDQVGMLDLPPPGHLLNQQFRIQEHRGLGGSEFERVIQTGNQPAVFGDVVGRPADGLLGLGQYGRAVSAEHHGAVAGRPRVSA
jgi:hypothetical protein